jgi:cytochrome c oxidase cbb3-type subunit 3
MSSVSSWVIIIGALGSIGVYFLLLQLNRQSARRGGQATGHTWDGIEEYDNPLPGWWYWMFVLSILFAIGYLAWYPGLGNFAGYAGWTSQQEVAGDLEEMQARYEPLYARYRGMSVEEVAAQSAARTMGQRLFANNCAPCHGSAAAGGPGFPDLTDSAWIWGGSPSAIEQSILGGRLAVMPAWQGVIPDPAVTDVVAYVRGLGGKPVDADAAARGQSTFLLYCVACHGPEGKGNPLLGAADLTDRAWLYGGSKEIIEATIRGGRVGQMPSFREKLGDDRVHILAGYIYGLSR